MRSRSLLLILTAALGVAAPARADSVTIRFTGADGAYFFDSATPVDDGYWLIRAEPFATTIGPGNPSFTGSPGVDFGAPWSIEHTDAHAHPLAVELDSLTTTFALVALGAPPTTIEGEASYSTQVASWSWDLLSPGPQLQDLAGVNGDTLSLTSTGQWQVTSVTLDWQPIPTGGGGGTVPEPCTASLAAIAVVILSLGLRATSRPREHRGGSCRADAPRPQARG